MGMRRYIVTGHITNGPAIGEIVDWDEDAADQIPWALQRVREEPSQPKASPKKPRTEKPAGNQAEGDKQPEADPWNGALEGQHLTVVNAVKKYPELTPEKVRELGVEGLLEFKGIGQATADALVAAAGEKPAGDQDGEEE